MAKDALRSFGWKLAIVLPIMALVLIPYVIAVQRVRRAAASSADL
ncbi:MAG: hypothetical protein ACRCZF_15385 [Gemmataceae bacterium]